MFFTETWTAQKVTKRVKDRGVGRSVSSLVSAGELQRLADDAAGPVVLFNHGVGRLAASLQTRANGEATAVRFTADNQAARYDIQTGTPWNLRSHLADRRAGHGDAWEHFAGVQGPRP